MHAETQRHYFIQQFHVAINQSFILFDDFMIAASYETFESRFKLSKLMLRTKFPNRQTLCRGLNVIHTSHNKKHAVKYNIIQLSSDRLSGSNRLDGEDSQPPRRLSEIRT